MPPTRKSSYSIYGYLTGWIPLCLIATNASGVAQAVPPLPSPGPEDQPIKILLASDVLHTPVTSPVGLEETVAVALAEPEPLANQDQQGLGAAYAFGENNDLPHALGDDQQSPPGGVVAGMTDTTLVAQANTGPIVDSRHTTSEVHAVATATVTAQPQPPGMVLSSGRPVPWEVAQLPPAVPGVGPSPAAVPPGYPVNGQPGLWMMVWMPYGGPMPTSSPAGMGGYYPAVPYAVIPGTVAGVPWPGGAVMPGPGLPYQVPGGTVSSTPTAGMLPGGPAWAGGYGTLPYPYGYGAPPTPGTFGNSGMAPAGMLVQPYALVAPPAMPAPLAVPALPNVASGSGQMGIVPPPSPSAPLASTTTPGFEPPVASPWLNAEASWTVPPGSGNSSPIAIAPTPSSTVTPVPTTGVPWSGSEVVVPGDINQPLTEASLNAQGLYILQGDQSSARARLSGNTFLTPNLLVGGTLDLVTGPDLTNDDGFQLTELYLATSFPGVPGLRFRLGQLDLTSYFDRNSFAKDIARDFFNSTFHTNPALIAGANATASRPGGLVQWAINDDINLSAAVFSSSPSITDFALDGFAGEVGFRTGDLILRGTFLSGRDTQFQGTGDRLDAYGINAEWFIPRANLGLFGRYGHLNSSGGFSGDTYSFGLNALDVFMDNDRLGVAYGRNLETASVNGATPDVLEVFYDFEALPNVRMGFTFQQRNQLRESFAGFRIRGDLDLLPKNSLR